MICDCIKSVNEKLADMNLALDVSIMFSEDMRVATDSLTISTHWKDPTKKPRGKKPTTIMVTYCPFCGVKATKDTESAAA
jgi:hypothetical protein